MKKVSLYSLCKHDIYLAAALATAVALLFVLFIVLRGDVQGNTAVITVNGQVYGTYRMDEEQDIVIDTENGYNKVHIAEGTVRMEEADCPDGYCILEGGKSRNKDTIVCLPHRVVVEIRIQNIDEMDEAEYDVISQ